MCVGGHVCVCVRVCECASVCVHVHACVNVHVCLREAREGVGFLELQLLAVVSCKMRDLGNKLGYGARVPNTLSCSAVSAAQESPVLSGDGN